MSTEDGAESVTATEMEIETTSESASGVEEPGEPRQHTGAATRTMCEQRSQCNCHKVKRNEARTTISGAGCLADWHLCCVDKLLDA